MRRFGVVPHYVAALSLKLWHIGSRRFRRQNAHRSGAHCSRAPDLEVEGEMHGDAALSAEVRGRAMRIHASKAEEAKLLIIPTTDAAGNFI
jgi:malate dehydrogenase (oxaloacetate-decarboxylating)(NADP+)